MPTQKRKFETSVEDIEMSAPKRLKTVEKKKILEAALQILKEDNQRKDRRLTVLYVKSFSNFCEKISKKD